MECCLIDMGQPSPYSSKIDIINTFHNYTQNINTHLMFISYPNSLNNELKNNKHI